ncbi:MAG TPA: hypothetical protein PKL13_03940 [bacterium]|nr:hypothetical protein [bacterium]
MVNFNWKNKALQENKNAKKIDIPKEKYHCAKTRISKTLNRKNEKTKQCLCD